MNLDRDHMQWLAQNPNYRNEPWKIQHCVRPGICALCGHGIDAYDSKWHHPDGRMVCDHHWLWTGDVVPPTKQWMYYTDG